MLQKIPCGVQNQCEKDQRRSPLECHSHKTDHAELSQLQTQAYQNLQATYKYPIKQQI